MQTIYDPTETYLQALIAGDYALVRSLFAGNPAVDDPLGGRVRGNFELEQFCAERHAWLVERASRVEPLRTTRNDRRTVRECLLHLQLSDHAVALPLAVVGEQSARTRLDKVRVYHSLWPLLGAHRVRGPLLPHDPTLSVTDVVAQYQHALAAGDVTSIVDAFEPDGYFREPAGGEYIYRGLVQLREFMAHILAPGGIGLEHCTMTDDGVACAIEFNAVRFGPRRLEPQAGVAVYERGPSGRLHAARVYDDVNVEALAGPAPTP